MLHISALHSQTGSGSKHGGWLQGHKSQVLCLAFSPDSTKMATASKDGTWRVWNINVRFHQQEDPKCLLQQPQEVRAQMSVCHATVSSSTTLYMPLVCHFWESVLVMSTRLSICIHAHAMFADSHAKLQRVHSIALKQVKIVSNHTSLYGCVKSKQCG